MSDNITPHARQAERTDFESEYGRDGNCSCHLSPPCSSCMHPGNPMQQAEDETCWEPDDGDPLE